MNNDNRSGCLATGIAIILVFLFFGGNAALFSGKIEGVGFAVAVAVIADLVIICWLVSKMANAIGKK